VYAASPPGAGTGVGAALRPGPAYAVGAVPRWAAVKVFGQRLLADADVRRRLGAGSRAATAVREPHLAPVIATGRGSQGSTWVASPLVPGPSLAAAVTETGPLPGPTAGWAALGVAGALAALHEAGLTHHAVSAGNVLLGAAGPVLTDFGVNKPTLLSGPALLSGLDGAAEDVRQLGRATFFAAAGRAFVAGDVLPGAPELAGCPPWLAPILRACLATDPARRPTAARLHEWLAEAAGPQPRSWLPGPVAARVAEHQALPPFRGRFRWPRPRTTSRE
jgi:serine/threonine protein kinase